MGTQNFKRVGEERGKGTVTFKYYFGALILMIFLSGVLPAQRVLSFKIVINKKNPVSTMTRDEVSKIFLKKNPRWENGELMLPVDLISTNPVREIFSRSVHQKPLSVIKVYWQKKIYSGIDLPPAEKMNDAEVLTFVSNHIGAIGYVSDKADLKSVKELQVRE
jgi:ABC-type phosphate transport system substrate-binding protein